MNNKNYTEIKLETTKDLTVDNLEEALFAAGALSVTLTSKADEVILIEPEPGELPLWEKGVVVTGLFARVNIDKALNVIKLCLGVDNISTVTSNKLEDKNWELEWTKYFKPIKFGDNLWITPSNQQVPKDKITTETKVITLDPGMAFGTGTHPTTAMVLDYLATNNYTDKNIIDYGCGSGILGIASLKMGAKHCLMVDIDSKAIETTISNSKINNVFSKITTIEASEINNNYADLLIANILLTPLIELKDEFKRISKKNSTIILTGLLQNQVDTIISHYQSSFTNFKIAKKEDWAMIVAKLVSTS